MVCAVLDDRREYEDDEDPKYVTLLSIPHYSLTFAADTAPLFVSEQGSHLPIMYGYEANLGSPGTQKTRRLSYRQQNEDKMTGDTFT